MIGPRMGLVVGPRLGVTVGLGADPYSASGGSVIPGVSRDATSGIYVPATIGEWVTLASVAGMGPNTPTSLWLCQESSGNLSDSIGVSPLVVAGTPTFGAANVGWVRKSVNITATTVQAFSIGTGTFDASAGSVAWLWYGCITATGAGRSVLAGSSNATGLDVIHLATDKLQIKCGANTATTVNTYTTSTIFPMLLVYNKTASTCTLYTSLEALPVTFATVVDGSKGLGAVGTLTGDASARTTYLAAFSGTAAEFSTANVRTLLQTLGWSPAF